MVSNRWISEDGIEPAGTYRPQYRCRWRGAVSLLDRFPRVKASLSEIVRHALRQVFEPGMVTTERVIEYPFVFQHLNEIQGAILDLGCCHSRLPIALASRGYRVMGMDFNPYPYRHPGLRAVRGDILQIPFAEGTFDAVLAISVIEHIGIGHYGDTHAKSGDLVAVGEIARVLNSSGKALVTVPFGRSLTNDWMRVYDSVRLAALLEPLCVNKIEYAVSRAGLWVPSSEAEAASIDWTGSDRSVALVTATKAGGRKAGG